MPSSTKERPELQPMHLVTTTEYRQFLASHHSVPIENVEVDLVPHWKIERLQPSEFAPEEWTVWSFPDRGDWATHVGNYRGNWSPYIPRNLILKYTSPGDTVCDPMAGSGTTLVECKLLERTAIGVDVNPDAAMVAMNRTDFRVEPLGQGKDEPEVHIYVGDARKLDRIDDESIDLVATHPPYCGIIPYSRAQVAGDLSSLNLPEFITETGRFADECYRILKPNKHCAILIGDTRKHRHYIPLHLGVLNKFLDAGFVLKEDVIKLQHNTKSGRERWSGHKYDFYKIGHEHLYVFRRPDTTENTTPLKFSKKWW